MKNKYGSGLLLLLAAIVFAIFFSGCSSVAPWQKAMLAEPAMTFISEQSSNTFEQHMLNAREASSGGYGGAGGGCGCK